MIVPDAPDGGQRELVEVTRVQAAAILKAGQEAGRVPSATVLECPYHPGGDASERVRAAAWIKGFLGVRRA